MISYGAIQLLWSTWYICSPINMWFSRFSSCQQALNTSKDSLRHLYASTSESAASKTLIKVTCLVAPRRIQTGALMIVDFILKHWVIPSFVIYISCIYIYWVSNKQYKTIISCNLIAYIILYRNSHMRPHVAYALCRSFLHI
jgi:hypothetical protein